MTDPEIAHRTVVSGDPGAIRGHTESLTTSLRTGSGAIQQLSQALLASANDYEATDQGVGHSMDGLAPR